MKKLLLGVFLVFCFCSNTMTAHAINRRNLTDCVAQLTPDLRELLMRRPAEPIEAYFVIDVTNKSHLRITQTFARQGLHVIETTQLDERYYRLRVVGHADTLHECLTRDETRWAGLTLEGFILATP